MRRSRCATGWWCGLAGGASPASGRRAAFGAEARGRNAGPTVALLAEYDALPEIGHACGHNLICTGALGAAVGLRQVLDWVPGRVMVLGTPAAGGGGGEGFVRGRGAAAGGAPGGG